MTINECIARCEEIERDWPSGVNFKNKSRFIGFELGNKTLSLTDLKSSDWVVVLESLDEEFKNELNGLFRHLNDPQS